VILLQRKVLVDDDGVAKICDVGLLRLVRDSVPSGVTIYSTHIETMRYLSYELVSAGHEDHPKPTTASDIYALACIGIWVSIPILSMKFPN
jgi:serine/threonine protein kinase